MKSAKLALAILGVAVAAGSAVAAPDEAAAKAFAKKNDCFKCHAVDKTKKGPSYKKIAEQIRTKGKTDAQLFEHLTVSKKVKLEDGSEEDHKALDKSEAAEIKNIIQWIKTN